METETWTSYMPYAECAKLKGKPFKHKKQEHYTFWSRDENETDCMTCQSPHNHCNETKTKSSLFWFYHCGDVGDQQ